MTIKSTQGRTLGVIQEASFGAGGTHVDVRHSERLDWPTSTRTGIAQPNTGHAHPASQADKPVWIETGREAAGALPVWVRRHGTANTAPPISWYFESMGCNIKTTTATTVTSYSDQGEWDLGDSGAAYGAVGDIIMPLLDDATDDLDNFYYPCLIAAKSTDTVNPAMELPIDTDDTEPIEVVTTIWPRSRVTPSGKTLSFKDNTRGDIAESGAEQLAYIYDGCVASSIDEITLTPNSPIIIPFNFHLADVDQDTDAIVAESFVDSERPCVMADAFRFGFADASSSGNITRADAVVKEVRIDLGISTVPIPGAGDGVLNGWQNYILQFGVPKVTITATYYGENAHPDYWTELEGSNTSQYIELVQPTDSLATPAWAFFMPNCHLDPENPPVIVGDGPTIDATVTYIASTAGFTSTTNNGLAADEGYAPWYMGISGSST